MLDKIKEWKYLFLVLAIFLILFTLLMCSYKYDAEKSNEDIKQRNVIASKEWELLEESIRKKLSEGY